MPELPEIHRFQDLINSKNQSYCFCSFTIPSGITEKHPPIPFLSSLTSWKLSAKARGKELVLTFISTSPSTAVGEEVGRLCFNHGLVGKWKWIENSESLPQHSVELIFETTNSNGCLVFEDQQHMGKWRVGDFGQERGPDPVDEFQLFRENVLKHKFSKNEQICEVLLDQSLFNGIGNYLRAEICYRAEVSPFASAHDVIHGPKGEKLLKLCRDIPIEVLEQGLNKYGNKSEIQKFENWLQVYGKGESKQVKGRKVWYTTEQLTWGSGNGITNPSIEPTTNFEESNGGMVSKLYQTGAISEQIRDDIKKALMKGSQLVIDVLTVYQIDNDHLEAADTFNRIFKRNQSDSSSELDLALDSFMASGNYSQFAESLIRILPSSDSSKLKSTVQKLVSNIHQKDWIDSLNPEFVKDYFMKLSIRLEEERKNSNIPIYPSNEMIFNALNLCPLKSVKCILLGQDPYHGPNQAHGLCFSVSKGIPPPPSLVNVFKEIQEDIGRSLFEMPNHGCLENWAKQGVLLLNAILTVQEHKPMSHSGYGWETFTDKIIEIVCKINPKVVFLLWGLEAQKKKPMIEKLSSEALILLAAHPSPMSGNKFRGCKHFSKTNQHLLQIGLTPINWNLDSESNDDEDEA